VLSAFSFERSVKVISSILELRPLISEAQCSSISIGFVPTMGALHEGHLSLVRMSKQECGMTVVSIFVNPTQFGANEDFSKYPRTFEDDCKLLESEGVDIVFAPQASEMYPAGASVAISVGEIATVFEGEIRPTHFSGVATVVASLFNIVQPTVAYFGQKDLQQVAVIKKLVRDLHFPTSITIGETIREADGLAMSSRNRYLSEAERSESLVLSKTLATVKEELLEGMGIADAVLAGKKFFADTAEKATLDYLAIIDPETFQIADSFKEGTRVGIIIAARLGVTRLIDNILLTY
jgi:pantoate--beta-alanine ligase